MRAILHVCTTCRGAAAGTDSDDARPGAALLQALASTAPDQVQVRGVECLSACSQGCAVALSAPGKWAYVYGRMTQADAPEILSGARAYAEAPDGIVPWRERPAVFRKQSLARIPPIPSPEQA